MPAPLTPETRQLLDGLAALGLPPLTSMTPAEARAMREEAARLSAAQGQEPVHQVADGSVESPWGAIGIRTYASREWDATSGATMVYFHGGGWVFGSLETHDGLCRALANASGLRIMAVDYRRAPEARHPAPQEDAWAVAVSVAARSEGPLLVGGDSAGGHIATCVAARARGTDLRLAGQLLVYPVTDLSSYETGSYRAFAEGYWLTRQSMEWFRDHYLGDTDRTDPDVSPLLRADLSDMPPAVVVAAECDVLRDEGLAYARRLEGAGCSVTYRQYDGVIHGFFAMPALIPEARGAIAEAADDLRNLVQRA